MSIFKSSCIMGYAPIRYCPTCSYSHLASVSGPSCPSHSSLVIRCAAYCSATTSFEGFGTYGSGVGKDAQAGIGVCFGLNSDRNLSESLTKEAMAGGGGATLKDSTTGLKVRQQPPLTGRRLEIFAAIRGLDQARSMLYSTAKLLRERRERSASTSCEGCVSGECRHGEDGEEGAFGSGNLVAAGVKEIVIVTSSSYLVDGITGSKKPWRRRRTTSRLIATRGNGSRHLSNADPNQLDVIRAEPTKVKSSSWFGGSAKKAPSSLDWPMFRELEHECLEISRIYGVKVSFWKNDKETSWAYGLARGSTMRRAVEDQ